MTIRCKQQERGKQAFLVGSERMAGVEYTVEHVRANGTRRFFCSCPDFQYRKIRRKRHCKHARKVATLAKVARGISRLYAAVEELQAAGTVAA